MKSAHPPSLCKVATGGNKIMKLAYALSQENEGEGSGGVHVQFVPHFFWLYDPRKVTYLLESIFSSFICGEI